MNIQPNTIIKIFNNIAIDNTYRNTIYFNNVLEQQNYFNSKVIATFTNNTYQRVNKNTLRINGTADNFYNCNYLAFQNSNFGNKWFYAFITNVEYINNDCIEISYEIDFIQTYLFTDCELLPSFVIREHSVTDNIGDNIISENIDIGDIKAVAQNGTGHMENGMSAVVFVKPLENKSKSNIISNIPQCLNCYTFAIPSQIGAMNDLISSFDNPYDTIFTIALYPSDLINVTNYEAVKSYDITFSRIDNFNDYIPKNNKLLTYPYNYISIDSGTSTAVYRYEWFAREFKFKLEGILAPSPQASLTPYAYNGTEYGSSPNYSEKITMSDFIQVGFAVDSFKNWLRQNQVSIATSIVSNASSVMTGLASDNVGGVLAGTSGLAQNINTLTYESSRPYQIRGTISNTVDVAKNVKDFRFRYMQITRQYAEIIDNYFTIYGYATNKLKVPNISSRPSFNYIKTAELNIKCNASTLVASKIQSIFNNGITFWKNGDKIGDYSQNNQPIVESE